jgi:outer membrane protein, multidrug efflux system
MPDRIVSRSRNLLLLTLSLGLAACAVGPDYREPKPEVDAAFAGQALVEAATQPPAAQWWKGFNDPLLDELVTDALAANRSIAAAAARLKEARAARREARFDYLPTVTGRASATRQRQSAGGSQFPIVDRDYDLYDAGFDAAWELDLFGRVRRGNEAARAARGAARASLDDMRLSVVAEVARNYFELRGAQQQLAVAERNASNQGSALELVRARFDAGRGTALDTARAEAQIETTLASVPPLEADVARARHRIEVLTGRRPGQLTDRLGPTAPLPQLPAQLLIDDPAAMLRRRPDVRVAERQLAATSARIGIATADLFPRLTLGGSIGLSAFDFDALDDSGNDYHRFGPSLSWALFDFGHVRERIKAAGARYEASFADYEQTVLVALEDVENALSDYSRERRRLGHLTSAARASVDAADLATQRFEGGISDFLTALDAYRTSLEAEDQLAVSQTAAATSLVALYKALGATVPDALP